MSDWASLEWTSSGYTTSGQWLDSGQFHETCARIWDKIRLLYSLRETYLEEPMRNKFLTAVGAVFSPLDTPNPAPYLALDAPISGSRAHGEPLGRQPDNNP